jgi:hypothetical protein
MPLPTDHSSQSVHLIFTLSSGFGQTTINLKQSMNTLYLAVLLTAAFTGKKDTVITHYRLRYDHTVLRIPGQSFFHRHSYAHVQRRFGKDQRIPERRPGLEQIQDRSAGRQLLQRQDQDRQIRSIPKRRFADEGGPGGRGGQGGSGGTGGIGDPSGNNGLDGMSGRDGFDGASGQKGKVVFMAI